MNQLIIIILLLFILVLVKFHINQLYWIKYILNCTEFMGHFFYMCD